MFESLDRLFLGLVTGFLFGFLLQKGRVAKYHVILGQLLLKDYTVIKIMLTAIAVGAIGVYGMVTMELVNLHIKPMVWGGVVVGGILFGIGMAIFGYCPGTGVAACGEGRKDAMAGVAGMLGGAGMFVGLYPVFLPVVNAMGEDGKITLPDITGIPAWIWILLIVGLTIGVRIIFSHSPIATRQQKEERHSISLAPPGSEVK